MRKFTLLISTFAAAIALAACGSSDSSPAPAAAQAAAPAAAPPAATSTTITGVAVKGPVSGATVTIKNAATGAVLATTTTSAGGAYSVATTFTGDVLVEVSGGSYTDEATGTTKQLTTPLRTVLSASGGTVTGVVTPLTTMAYTYSGSANPNAEAFKQAAEKIAGGLGLSGTNILNTVPDVNTGTMNDYGKSLRALSQYLKDNPGTDLSTLVSTAMASSTFSAFSVSYGAAYSTINGSPITVSFNGGNVVTLSGIGTGTGTAGSASCGLAIGLNGTNLVNICYVGLVSADECSSSNAELAADAAEQQAAFPGSSFTFTPACVANPTFTIDLK
jgi:hypothetical protein